MKLNVKTVEKLLRDRVEGAHADDESKGLYLRVLPSGAGSWAFRFQLAGKRGMISLGPVAHLTLAEARSRAHELRGALQRGEDPRLAPAEAEPAAVPTFRQAVETFISAHRAGWRNAKHAQQWTNTLTEYAFPHFGDKPLDQISTADVMAALNPIWATKNETARRVRSRIENVLDAGKAQGWRTGENPARWRGHLDKLLPRRSKVAPVVHQPSLPWEQAPAFMTELREKTGVSAEALEFAILTAARYGEVAGATWREIDLDAKLWRIPAVRMKAGRPHAVPLSSRAIEILQGRPRRGADTLIFPGPRSGKALSDSTLGAVIDKLHRASLQAGGAGWLDPVCERVATQHGMRATFRTWILDGTFHSERLAEICLAHQGEDETENAYRRGQALEKRREIMQDWCDFLNLKKTVA